MTVCTSVFQPFQWSGTLHCSRNPSRSLGEHCKLPQWGSERSPDPKYIWTY